MAKILKKPLTEAEEAKVVKVANRTSKPWAGAMKAVEAVLTVESNPKPSDGVMWIKMMVTLQPSELVFSGSGGKVPVVA